MRHDYAIITDFCPSPYSYGRHFSSFPNFLLLGKKFFIPSIFFVAIDRTKG